MKNCFLYILLPFFALALSACGGDDGGGDEPVQISLTLSQTEITASAKAASVIIDVATTAPSWTAASLADWVTVTPTSAFSSSGKVTVAISANTGVARTGEVIVRAGSASQTITINQGEAFRISKSEAMLKSGGDEYSLTVSGSKNWTAKAEADWITATRKDDATLLIAVEPTSELATRSGKVTLTADGEEATFTVNQESVEVTDIETPEGYTLVWHDEFNESSELNAEHWTHEVQKKGWVNNEEQNYVNGAYNGKRVTELSDGKLRIHCFKSGSEIYSGRVYAHVDKGWQYGYIEARIMLPKGKGTWPAFWMMPVTVDWTNEGWPKCGEIDIMEEVGTVPNEVSSSLHAEGHNHTNNTQVTQAKKISKAEGEFHTYAIKWTEENITTYVDGEPLLSYDNDGKGITNWPYSKPYYIILNLAWGGSWGGMNGTDETALPVSYVIDYVRVFQK